MAKVNIITKKVILPTERMVLTLMEAPRRMIAAFRTFLEVNFKAGSIHAGWKKLLINVPMKRAMIDAPSSSPGISFSKSTERAATAKQIAIPSRNMV